MCAVLSTVLTLIGPDKLSEMTDCITEGVSPDTEKLEEITETVSQNISGNTESVVSIITVNCGSGTQINDVEINGITISANDQIKTLEILSNVEQNDEDNMQDALNELPESVQAVVLFAGSLIMMLTTNGIMTVIAVVASLLGFVFMFVIMGRSQKYFAQQQKNLGKLNGHVEEMYAGHTVVKAYNGEENSGKVFDELNSLYKFVGKG